VFTPRHILDSLGPFSARGYRGIYCGHPFVWFIRSQLCGIALVPFAMCLLLESLLLDRRFCIRDETLIAPFDDFFFSRSTSNAQWTRRFADLCCAAMISIQGCDSTLLLTSCRNRRCHFLATILMLSRHPRYTVPMPPSSSLLSPAFANLHP